jgi:hypothetical protein
MAPVAQSDEILGLIVVSLNPCGDQGKTDEDRAVLRSLSLVKILGAN